MITIRFESHGDYYQVFSCDRYSVKLERCAPEGEDEIKDPDGTPFKRGVHMFRSLNDDNPHYLSVGEREPYGIAYVMNDSGKTIDTIR